MRQLIRHRTANVNEYSGRYSVMPLMFYTPEREQVALQSKANRQGREGGLDISSYNGWVAGLSGNRGHASLTYQDGLRKNVARELARIDLPLSMYTFCYWKMDLRNLLHLIGLRSDPHAQWEIQQFSNVMAGLTRKVAPLSLQAFVDYQLTAATFSGAEVRAMQRLSRLGRLHICQNSVPTGAVAAMRKSDNETLAEFGIKGREADEFWAKLEPKEAPAFDLDLSTAKPPEYFENMMTQYAVEVEP
jgi:thymidylate synthase ThyX